MDAGDWRLSIDGHDLYARTRFVVNRDGHRIVARLQPRALELAEPLPDPPARPGCVDPREKLDVRIATNQKHGSGVVQISGADFFYQRHFSTPEGVNFCSGERSTYPAGAVRIRSRVPPGRYWMSIATSEGYAEAEIERPSETQQSVSLAKVASPVVRGRLMSSSGAPLAGAVGYPGRTHLPSAERLWTQVSGTFAITGIASEDAYVMFSVSGHYPALRSLARLDADRDLGVVQLEPASTRAQRDLEYGFNWQSDGTLLIVDSSGVAAQAGLRDGDQVLSIDEVPIEKLAIEQRNALLAGPIGGKLTLRVRQRGKVTVVTLQKP